MQNVDQSKTTTLHLVLAWCFVGIPLLAGVTPLGPVDAAVCF